MISSRGSALILLSGSPNHIIAKSRKKNKLDSFKSSHWWKQSCLQKELRWVLWVFGACFIMTRLSWEAIHSVKVRVWASLENYTPFVVTSLRRKHLRQVAMTTIFHPVPQLKAWVDQRNGHQTDWRNHGRVESSFLLYRQTRSLSLWSSLMAGCWFFRCDRGKKKSEKGSSLSKRFVLYVGVSHLSPVDQWQKISKTPGAC